MKLSNLNSVIPFSALAKDPELSKEIEVILNRVGLLKDADVNGLVDNNTINGLVNFKKLRKLTGGNFIGPTTRDSLLSVEELKLLVSQQQYKKVYDTLDYWADFNSALLKHKITSLRSIRHFMAQCGHESASLLYIEEIASGNEYEGDTDLGNIYAGDGARYKGVSFLQMTGRNNYQAFSNSVGDVNVMKGHSYVAQHYAWGPSCFWWLNNDMNSYCDEGATIRQVSGIVNAGSPTASIINGLEERIEWYNKVVSIL